VSLASAAKCRHRASKTTWLQQSKVGAAGPLSSTEAP
jgi:hypothetical protein